MFAFSCKYYSAVRGRLVRKTQLIFSESYVSYFERKYQQNSFLICLLCFQDLFKFFDKIRYENVKYEFNGLRLGTFVKFSLLESVLSNCSIIFISANHWDIIARDSHKSVYLLLTVVNWCVY